jgi:hypothetical protein
MLSVVEIDDNDGDAQFSQQLAVSSQQPAVKRKGKSHFQTVWNEMVGLSPVS